MAKQNIFTFCAVLLLLAGGCKKNNPTHIAEADASNGMKTISTGSAANDGMTVLGDKLKNPYTVENMAQAKRNLEARGITSKNNFTVRETHLYVKFKPKDEEQYKKLCADKELDLYDFPLDYNIEVLGNYYREPGLSDATPTPQYAVVPLGYRFDEGISHEIIANMYVPEKDEQLMGVSLSEDYRYLGELLNETYLINPPNDRFPDWYLQPAETGANDGFSGGAPDGFVRVFDTRLNRLIPLEWVDIRTLHGMTTYHGTTDNTGEYWLDNWFSGSSIVKVHLEKEDFLVMSSSVAIAEIIRASNGTYCDVTINNGMERMYATIFRAANRYYYGDVAGLRRPGGGLLGVTLGIWGMDEANPEFTGHYDYMASNLKVMRRENGRELGTDEIFGVAIHELAHSAHMHTMNAPWQYPQVENRIAESWALGVQWLVTNMEYREKGVTGYGDWNYNPGVLRRPHRFGYQNWSLPNATSADYTSLFINLVDNFNEQGQNFPNFGTSTVNDPVAGYDLSIIQSNYLKNIYGLSSMATKLKANKPVGVTDVQIDILLNNY